MFKRGGGDDDDDAHPSSKLEWPEQSRMCSRLRLLYMKTIIIIMQIIQMIIWTHLTLVPKDCLWEQPNKKSLHCYAVESREQNEQKLFEPKIKELFVDNNNSLTLWLLLDDALALL